MDWCRHHHRAFGRSDDNLERRRGQASLGSHSIYGKSSESWRKPEDTVLRDVCAHVQAVCFDVDSTLYVASASLQSIVVLTLGTLTIYKPESTAAIVKGCADARMSP